jgi:large conductance mechanosensitive channel
MALIADFKQFALKGNVIDLAVGVVIGAAFGGIVNAMVSGLIMPLVSLVLPKGSWQTASFVLKHGDTPAQDVVLQYGVLLAAIVNFLIISFVLFIVVSKIVKAFEKPAAKTTRECPECLGEVPLAAKRCRHCTSVIGT